MSNNPNHNLEIRSIGNLKGCFRIPAYQRGYRWERRQVEQLLDDLLAHHHSDKGKPYYMQPIVVAPIPEDELAKLEEGERFDYDLIDGQQRLTTLYLIFRVLKSAKDMPLLDELSRMGMTQEELMDKITLSGNLKGANTSVDYELIYQTRKDSREFLKNISDKGEKDPAIRKTPDHLYMWHAYQVIEQWMKVHTADVKAVADVLNDDVRVIWYELEESVPSWKKFKDLNSGKIDLTNSELIKALVLRRKVKEDLPDYEQDVIVSQWDEIEQALSDEKFWRFLTKKPMKDYPTKIDLLFDLLSGKSGTNKKDEYFTFRYFSDLFEENRKKGKKSRDNWTYIHDRYRRIRDWYLDPWMYHRVGYLVAVGDDSELREIYEEAYLAKNADNIPLPPLTHDKMREKIEERICKTLSGTGPLEKLSYNKDNERIIKVLTLYNVMLADELSAQGIRYPFDAHDVNGNGGWSLEHIHAQNSEDLKGSENWMTWVQDQLASLQRIKPQFQSKEDGHMQDRVQALEKLMRDYPSDPTEDKYKSILTEYLDVISVAGFNNKDHEMHSIANLALLSKDDNAALNKSTFDVKRMRIASRSSTNFVPIGTERVFMKAIIGSSKDEKGNPIPNTEYSCNMSQMFFWGDDDRNAYLRDIEEKIGKYLPKETETPINHENDGPAES